jgi:hypothetical protein
MHITLFTFKENCCLFPHSSYWLRPKTIMKVHECRRLLIHYAHHNPKSSTLALLAGTTLTFATFIFAVSARDERLAREHHAKLSSSSNSNNPDAHHKISLHEAQVQAMIENARNSSWRQNLENAVDAQERFVLPNRQHVKDVPEYVQRIDERSKEILTVQQERNDKEADEKSTRFWR